MKRKVTEPKGFDFNGAKLVKSSETAEDVFEGIPPVDVPESVLKGSNELVLALAKETSHGNTDDKNDV